MIKNQKENKMEKMQESFNKDLEELKNKHTETNNTITEIKNTLQRIKNYCCLGSNSDHLNQNHKGLGHWHLFIKAPPGDFNV